MEGQSDDDLGIETNKICDRVDVESRKSRAGFQII